MKTFDNTFVKIIAGKHAGEYGYIEYVYGDYLVVVSGKPNGDRFECLVSPTDTERNLSENEMRIAKDCALNFYRHDIASMQSYLLNCESKDETERVFGIMIERINHLEKISNNG